MATYLYPPVSVTTLPPLGGATAANQATEIASLASIDGKLTNQATAAKQDTGNASLASIDAKNPALVSGKVPVDTGLTQGLTDTQLRAVAVPVSVSNFPATQPVSGPLTDAQLRATAVPVIANAGTNLNTSALALESTQLLIKAKTDNLDVLLSTRATNADLLLMSAKLPATLGQKTMAASLAVTIASDQSILPVTLSPPTVAGTDDSSAVVDSVTGVVFAKPTNAKNMVIFNNAADVDTQPATNANRVRIGQAPNWATGVGAILSPGGSTALLPASAFKALAENASANANLTVLWFY